MNDRADGAHAQAAEGFRLAAATGLHKGDRPYQQDQVLMLEHPRSAGCMLGLVADGMGGRSGGRKASDQVLLTARQLFARYKPGRDQAADVLRQLLDEANTVIKLTALSSEQEPHSTVAAYLLDPDGSCAWIHAGDSRIYYFRHGALVTRTKDHSYVQALIDRGDIDEAEANVHPQANILLGCLGMKTTPPPVEIHQVAKLEPGDLLMACSDGLWHYFTDDEMGSALAAHTPRAGVEMLVAEARRRARGSGDNISLAVLKVEHLPAATSRA